jgi:uncharacterized protein YcaQ
MICISNLTARKLALNQQGLLSAKPKFGRGKKAALKAIEQLGYVQIDAISVIQRAHHHTLWSRVPGYKPQFLYTMLNEDQSIFEYWSHAAAFLPIKHYPYALPVMQTLSTMAKHWYEVDPDYKSQVLARIKENGPLYARDFETPKSSGGMWSRKPAKKALHELFMEGSIAVRSRESFQRLYDITEKVIPLQYTLNPPSVNEYIWHRCQQAIQAHGVVSVTEIGYQRYVTAKQIASVLKTKEAEGKVVTVEIGKSNRTYFSFPDFLEKIPGRVIKQLHFLSPFDNAVIQRKRLNELFGFDYQTEIYYPVNKRKYGYFSLPVLHGTEFIGRMDPKAFRDQKVLEIRNLALEPWVKITDRLVDDMKSKLAEFAMFNDCLEFKVNKTTPAFLKSVLC